MFVLGTHLFLYYLFFTGYHHQFPIILGLLVPLPLVHGPFLLFYISSLIKRHQRFRRRQLLHFIPSISYYILLLPIFMLPLEGQRAFVFEQLPVDPPLYVMFFSILVDVSGVTYVCWSLILLRKHQKNIGDEFSYIDKINLNWLRNIIIGMALVWVAVLAGNFLEELESSNLVFGTVVLFIFLVGYYGSRQGIIFTDLLDATEPRIVQETKNKYQRSGLTKDRSQQYLRQLLDYMEKGKPHLDSKMNLSLLANRLEINPNYISQIINDQLQLNFYDFINQYRVEEFKNRLNDKTAIRYTLLSHALASGFSSKSSFNEVFKRITGQTPSEFQKNLPSTN